jgi:uridine kinase
MSAHRSGPRSPRQEILATVAADVLRLPGTGRRRIAVDGVDGAGKTHFADELARELARRGAAVVRASVDGFHHPPEVRYRLGRSSPEGFFRDSYDHDRLRLLLLDPLGPHGSGQYVSRIYDVHAEQPAIEPPEQAPPNSVLVLDGIFLHRDELAPYWDYSIWLRVPLTVSIPRGAQRGYGDPSPDAPSNNRYVEGQRLYLGECTPEASATVVIDNTDLERPLLLRNPR